MQRIEELNYSIRNNVLERGGVLMVMIPRADLRLREYRKIEIDAQHIGITHQKIESKIQRTKWEDEEYGPAVWGMFKHCKDT